MSHKRIAFDGILRCNQDGNDALVPMLLISFDSLSIRLRPNNTLTIIYKGLSLYVCYSNKLLFERLVW